MLMPQAETYDVMYVSVYFRILVQYSDTADISIALLMFARGV
jgi:hypothetical protein